jgi:hypothetical protein
MKTVLFFTQASCAPCREIEPSVKGACDHYAATMQYIRVDTEAGRATAQSAGEIATPVVIVLDSDKKEIGRLRGKTEILSKLESLLKQNTEGSLSNKKKVVGALIAAIVLYKIFN